MWTIIVNIKKYSVVETAKYSTTLTEKIPNPETVIII